MKVLIGIYEYRDQFFDNDFSECITWETDNVPERWDWVVFPDEVDKKLFAMVQELSKSDERYTEEDLNMKFWRVVERYYDYQNQQIYLSISYNESRDVVSNSLHELLKPEIKKKLE